MDISNTGSIRPLPIPPTEVEGDLIADGAILEGVTLEGSDLPDEFLRELGSAGRMRLPSTISGMLRVLSVQRLLQQIMLSFLAGCLPEGGFFEMGMAEPDLDEQAPDQRLALSRKGREGSEQHNVGRSPSTSMHKQTVRTEVRVIHLRDNGDTEMPQTVFAKVYPSPEGPGLFGDPQATSGLGRESLAKGEGGFEANPEIQEEGSRLRWEIRFESEQVFESSHTSVRQGGNSAATRAPQRNESDQEGSSSFASAQSQAPDQKSRLYAREGSMVGARQEAGSSDKTAASLRPSDRESTASRLGENRDVKKDLADQPTPGERRHVRSSEQAARSSRGHREEVAERSMKSPNQGGQDLKREGNRTFLPLDEASSIDSGEGKQEPQGTHRPSEQSNDQQRRSSVSGGPEAGRTGPLNARFDASSMVQGEGKSPWELKENGAEASPSLGVLQAAGQQAANRAQHPPSGQSHGPGGVSTLWFFWAVGGALLGGCGIGLLLLLG
jgi:hypothetical protein